MGNSEELGRNHHKVGLSPTIENKIQTSQNFEERRYLQQNKYQR